MELPEDVLSLIREYSKPITLPRWKYTICPFNLFKDDWRETRLETGLNLKLRLYFNIIDCGFIKNHTFKINNNISIKLLNIHYTFKIIKIIDNLLIVRYGIIDCEFYFTNENIYYKQKNKYYRNLDVVERFKTCYLNDNAHYFIWLLYIVYCFMT